MKLANLHIEARGDASELWQSILSYANGEGATKDFRHLALQGFKRLGIENAEKVLKECGDVKSGASMKQLEDRYREPLRDVLRWIVRPSAFSPMDTREIEERMGRDMNAVAFLTEQAAMVKVNLALIVILSTGDCTAQSFFKRMVTESHSVLSGMCQFILGQIGRHDVDGEPLEKLFPFQLCEREGCERFFYVQRTGRGRWCSDTCRSMGNTARMTKEQKAQRMRDYRAGLKRRDAANLTVAQRSK